jgi:hypothetical protein
MSFNRNTRIIGQHAFLSPSSYHWLDYDEDKLRRVYFARQEAARGDKIHSVAQQLITLGIRQADNGTTLSMYVNDAIGYRMAPEVGLYYNDACFGTTDCIGYREEKWPDVKDWVNTLRISDLKTGVTPADMKQVKIYAGLFFLEYAIIANPNNTRTVLRIYQNDQIEELIADPADILIIMNRIETQAKLVEYLREED